MIIIYFTKVERESFQQATCRILDQRDEVFCFAHFSADSSDDSKKRKLSTEGNDKLLIV